MRVLEKAFFKNVNICNKNMEQKNVKCKSEGTIKTL